MWILSICKAWVYYQEENAETKGKAWVTAERRKACLAQSLSGSGEGPPEWNSVGQGERSDVCIITSSLS